MTDIISRPGADKFAYICINTNPGLPSAARDAIAHGITFGKRGFKLNYYFDVNDREYNTIIAKLRDEKLDLYASRNLDELKVTLAKHAETKKETDIIVAISSHGYREAHIIDYIKFGGKAYMDTTIESWFEPLKSNQLIKCLILVDTCHSAHMCKFPYSGPDLPKEAHICSISACADQQSDMDDISSNFGFGGGLTSAVMDYLDTSSRLNGSESFSINDLFIKCNERLLKAGVHPMLCWL